MPTDKEINEYYKMANSPIFKRDMADSQKPDSFFGMGLNQEYLKAELYQRIKPFQKKTNSLKWIEELRTAEQDYLRIKYVMRFIWNNLPVENMTSQKLETMLYNNAPLGLFFHREVGLVLTPVAIGSIPQNGKKSSEIVDYIGNPQVAYPVPYAGTSEIVSQQSKLDLSKIGARKVLWDIPLVDETTDERELIKMMEEYCVLLYDHTPEFQTTYQTFKPKDLAFTEGLIQSVKMSQVGTKNLLPIPLVRTTSVDEAQRFKEDMYELDNQVLDGVRFFPVNSFQELQDIAPQQTGDVQQFWSNFVSIHNWRDTLAGISNDGVVQKSQYQNVSSQAIDTSSGQSILLDSYLCRIKFCAIATALFGVEFSCESTEMMVSPDAQGGAGEAEQSGGGKDDVQPKE